MPLSSGTRLGPYEILGAIGAGGMGEVYRARDTRLERIVAIKTLPHHLSSDPTLRQRFEREAKTISSLNHPHICTLYDVGHQDGTEFLVMEYIEGETLAARLEKGPLPLDQVLKYGIEIADALDKAHRSGVVHRDLKPGNIMLTKSGTKLMDFGLAKPAEPALDLTSSAAGTVSRPLTAEGTIVGTFQYMSPEQLQGKQADTRSDIFSFGAMLYEMAAGRPAFAGKSSISVLAAILERDPEPLSNLQPLAPPALEYVVKTCMAKDPEDRVQTAHDVRLQLSWIAQGSASAAGAGLPFPGTRVVKWQTLAWRAAAVLGLACAVILALLYVRLSRERPAGTVARFTMPLGKGQELAVDSTLALALSPDGKQLAYVAAENSVSRLYLRPLDQFDSVAVPDSEGATFPFFSENGQWVAFFSQGKLKKAPVVGGSPVVVSEVPSFLGGTWTPEGQIIFALPGLGLASVSAAGGTPRSLLLATGKRYSPARPVTLPDDQWLMFTNYGEGASEILALNQKSKEVRPVVSNALEAHYSEGRLVYYASGTLWAAPFDLKNASVTGPAVAIASGVGEQNMVGQFAASRTGVLVYAPQVPGSFGRSLYWVDRKGSARRIDLPSQDYVDPHISPDGKRFVVAIRRVGEQSLAVFDIDRGVLMRMSANGGDRASPAWTPDGKELVFDSVGPSTTRGIYRMAADGATPPQLVRELSANGHVTSVSPDGEAIVMLADPVTSTDLWLLSLNGNHDFHPFRRTPAAERQGCFSPDGRWLVYGSNESGTSEIYVEAVPGPGGRWQISTDGGEQPRWPGNGREIFYRNGANLMVVAVETRQGFVAAKPARLFDLRMDRGGAVPGYDVSPDGRAFLMIKSDQPNPTEIRMVIGWPDKIQESPKAK
jgi:Tol biopolymer transport system component/predicted Ser/Thr protein kinase